MPPSLTINSDGQSQNQITPTIITQIYVSLPPCSFASVFRPFPSLYNFPHSPIFYLFPQLLKCRKMQKMFSLENFCE